MKKYIFMATALMMMGLGLSSCSNDDVINEVEQAPKKVQLTLTASFDMEGDTRAAWGTDGATPKFVAGDKVAVYSDNHAEPELLSVSSIDASGNATLSGSVTEASVYHLVFCGKGYDGTNYDSSTKKITGFYPFYYSKNKYPEYALHYAMASSLEASVTFHPLCAILKGAQTSTATKLIYIKSASLNYPEINVDGTGGATVAATVDTPSDEDLIEDYYMVSYGISNKTNVKYYPVAPGSVTLIKGSISGPTKTTTVEAGKIYTVAP